MGYYDYIKLPTLVLPGLEKLSLTRRDELGFMVP